MRILLSTAFAAAMLLSCPTFADDAIVIESTPAQIRTAQSEQRQAIERKSGNYSHFTDDERKTIFAKQDEVLRLIDGKQTVEELGPDGKIALANALASVDAAVTRAEDNRLICERVKPVGSNRPQNKCISVGERRRQRDAAQRQGLRATN
ncbi:MAG: hypothetical protein HOP03_04780 [Lysobacter sp.]|nr:hypothetical protein [Lysobacter sp.]